MTDATVHEYFSDREQGPRPPRQRDFDERVWQGVEALIHRFAGRGDFGASFPERCTDRPNPPIGTDLRAFEAALRVEVPDWRGWRHVPDAPTACDFLEFCYRHAAQATVAEHHAFMRHDHLDFDQQAGQAAFRAELNLILNRNGLAFTMTEAGKVERLLDDPAGQELLRARFNTGDARLDELLEEARSKFLDPDPRLHQEAVERLWDAWERLKTVKNPEKRRGSAELLDACTKTSALREMLEVEALSLTDLGNGLHIRHSETTQTRIDDPLLLDYMFQRLFALVHLILNKNGMLG